MTTNKNNPHGLQVGQTLLWVKQHGGNQNVTVQKIGRAWAEIKTEFGRTGRVCLTSLKMDGGGHSYGRCYTDADAYRNELALNEAWSKLRHEVGNTYKTPANMTLEKIQQIRKLLEA